MILFLQNIRIKFFLNLFFNCVLKNRELWFWLFSFIFNLNVEKKLNFLICCLDHIISTSFKGSVREKWKIQKDATYDLDCKKIYLISNKSFRYYTLWSSTIFRHICIYSWFFIVCFNCYDLRVTHKNIFEDFW